MSVMYLVHERFQSINVVKKLMMRYTSFIKEIGDDNIKLDESLANYTNLKIGGPADILFEAHSIDDLVNTIKLSREHNVPFTVLGWGSNILVADRGIRGIVIINKTSNIEILDGKEVEVQKGKREYKERLEQPGAGKDPKYLGDFRELDYDETDKQRVSVIADSGVSLPYLMKYTIDKGITGLQWYSGIPGTVGGAVFNNIHGGTHFIGEVIDTVKVLTTKMKIKALSIEQLGTDYDKSIFHDSGDIILKAKFNLFRGDKEKAIHVVREWAKRKAVQPKATPGCVFGNITQEKKEELGIETTSIGYIVEHMLKMTGFSIGDAEIYPKHHNFIVNRGNATAAEYLGVIKEIQRRAKKELNVDLVPEIFFFGFNKEELRRVVGKDKDRIRMKRNDEIKRVYN